MTGVQTCALPISAPAAARTDDGEDRVFQLRFDRVEPAKVRERIVQEQKFDPDLWVIGVEMRSGELGLSLVK